MRPGSNGRRRGATTGRRFSVLAQFIQRGGRWGLVTTPAVKITMRRVEDCCAFAAPRTLANAPAAH